MADFNGSLMIDSVEMVEVTPEPSTLQLINSVITRIELTPEPSLGEITSGLGVNIITYYKMRALKDPEGSGFVSWISTNNPDPDGESAPEAIVANSAVIMASWIG